MFIRVRALDQRTLTKRSNRVRTKIRSLDDLSSAGSTAKSLSGAGLAAHGISQERTARQRQGHSCGAGLFSLPEVQLICHQRAIVDTLQDVHKNDAFVMQHF